MGTKSQARVKRVGWAQMKDGKNWSRWYIQMKPIFGYQDVSDIVEEDLQSWKKELQKHNEMLHKQNNKKDCETICLLY
ncbi:hypothetical protein Lal_00000870 [Lupinus albus]|nr:hypothetical protein Lal_00000870 [Lupinus albus]